MQQDHTPTEPTGQTDRETGHGPNAGRRVVSSVETDLFCEGCGYNLRTQKVWEEPTTKVLIIQCPECNKYHAARGIGGAKLAIPDRLVQLAGIGWVLFLGLIFIAVGAIEMSALLVFTDVVSSGFRDEYLSPEIFLPLLFIVPMGLTIGGLIAIFSSSPSLNWARWMVSLRSAIYLLGLGFMAIDLYTSSYAGPKVAVLNLLVGFVLIVAQFTSGMLGVYLGRPVFYWLCRNLLPASIANMIRAYWSSQTIAAPGNR
jgi:hypothetical protein